MPWFKPDGKVLFNVKTHALRAYRVDTLQPNPLIVKGVVKKAGSADITPMMTAEQEAWWAKNVEKKTLGVDNIYSEESRHLRTLQESLRKSNRMPLAERKYFPNLQTGYLQNKGSARKFLINHCRNEDELFAVEFVWNNPQFLHFEKSEELGAVKDMSTKEAQRNIAKKMSRGVQSYNLYSFVYRGRTWHVKMEVYKNMNERLYSLTR